MRNAATISKAARSGLRARESALAASAIDEVLGDDDHAGDHVALSADPQMRHEMICTTAYYIAEQRGFAPGHEVADWLMAEQLVDADLRSAASNH